MNIEMGRRIRDLRTARELTQAELAEKVGCGTNHISYIETGSKLPSLQLLIDIVRELDTSFDYLLLENFDEERRTLIECDKLYKEVNTLKEEAKNEFFEIAFMLAKSYKKIEKK